MQLTVKKCDTATREKDGVKLFDGGGLYLELHKNGRKYWRYKYRFLGVEKLLALGVYPETSLAEARAKHAKARKLLEQNIDPNQAKQDARRSAKLQADNTFEVIAREWYATKTKEWSKSNAKTALDRLEKDVFPQIGKYPIKSLTHKQLLDLANTVKERGASELAKRIIQMSRHIFQYAIITGRADRNIAEDLKGLVKGETQSHFAAIEAQDLPQFMADLRNHKAKLNRQTYLALNFLMLTFVRTGEMINAEWSEFDFKEKTWLIPAHKMKMKKDHLVPLSRQAIAILEELREIHNHPTLVFPSRHDRKRPMSNNTILMALARRGYRGKMTGHGFRSLAMSTIMEKLHYRHEVPDAQLAHAKRHSLGAAYDRAKFLTERIKMMQEWSDFLDNVAQGGTVITGDFGNRKKA